MACGENGHRDVCRMMVPSGWCPQSGAVRVVPFEVVLQVVVMVRVVVVVAVRR